MNEQFLGKQVYNTNRIKIRKYVILLEKLAYDTMSLVLYILWG